MQQHKAQPISEILGESLRAMGLEKSYLEHRIIEVFPTVISPTVAHYTRDIQVEDGMLTLHVTNAALRQELFEHRFDLVRKLNHAVGGEAIKDVRLR